MMRVTELQKVFLFYTFLYFVLKGGCYVALYVALIIVEKNARLRHERFLKYHRQKRVEEQNQWKVAYNLYEKKKDVPETIPLSLAQLVANPNSFTTYSFVKPVC